MSFFASMIGAVKLLPWSLKYLLFKYDLKEIGLACDKMCRLTLEQNFYIILMGFIELSKHNV